MYHKLDNNKNVVPATREEVAGLFEDTDARRVRYDVDEGTGNWLSTVFLVIEHGGGMFFETAISLNGNITVIDRYRTYKQAEQGHEEHANKINSTYQ